MPFARRLRARCLRQARRRSSSKSLLAGLLAFALAACASAPTPTPEQQELDPEVAVQAFDDAWTAVRDGHFDPNLNGVDWDAVREELRPRAEKARTDEELVEVLNEMVGRLGQSHFAVIPRDALPAASDDGTGSAATPESVAADAGFDVRIRGGAVLVTRVKEGGPAAAAGVKPGWVLQSIDGSDLAPEIEWLGDGRAQGRAERMRLLETTGGVEARLVGPLASRVKLAFLDEQDQTVELELERAERDVVAHSFGTTLPTFYLHFESEVLERDGLRVGRIHFTNWFLPMQPRIDAAVDEMRDCDGIVIDLRGNGGGAGGMVMGTAGHFFAERTVLGTQTMRNDKLIYTALPRKVSADAERVEPYAGPVAVLIDDLTGSASEIFAGGMQSTGRARVFGETSVGAVLPATTTKLASGDSLLYAFGDFKTAKGEVLEGRGVIPDVETPITRAALLAGGDPALDAALAWIAETAAR